MCGLLLTYMYSHQDTGYWVSILSSLSSSHIKYDSVTVHLTKSYEVAALRCRIGWTSARNNKRTKERTLARASRAYVTITTFHKSVLHTAEMCQLPEALARLFVYKTSEKQSVNIRSNFISLILTIRGFAHLQIAVRLQNDLLFCVKWDIKPYSFYYYFFSFLFPCARLSWLFRQL